VARAPRYVSTADDVLRGLHWRQGYNKWGACGQAKSANVLFAVQLDKLGRDVGGRAFVLRPAPCALQPGGIITPFQRHLPKEEVIANAFATLNSHERMGRSGNAEIPRPVRRDWCGRRRGPWESATVRCRPRLDGPTAAPGGTRLAPPGRRALPGAIRRVSCAAGTADASGVVAPAEEPTPRGHRGDHSYTWCRLGPTLYTPGGLFRE
jgi:hypothetical protein